VENQRRRVPVNAHQQRRRSRWRASHEVLK